MKRRRSYDELRKIIDCAATALGRALWAGLFESKPGLNVNSEALCLLV